MNCYFGYLYTRKYTSSGIRNMPTKNKASTRTAGKKKVELIIPPKMNEIYVSIDQYKKIIMIIQNEVKL